jgi:Sec-independent protein translocase protein TatA
MARQAGKLLAELRRASNEFKSQIETEIAHLEVEKTQTVLPPSPPPQGTVASLNSNSAANDSVPQLESANNVDSSVALAAPPLATPADSNSAAANSTPPVDAVVESSVSTAQEPHA